MNEEIAKEYIALLPNLFGGFSELNKDSVELSHMQSHVLEYLYMQKKAVNLKDISSGLAIAKQQLTNIIKDLEAGGYLVKVPDPEDKRAVLVSLTPAGRELEEKKWIAIYQKFMNNLAKLNEEEKRDLAFALHKVNVLLQKLED